MANVFGRGTAYWTLGATPGVTAPLWACHSLVSWPSPLYARSTWFTTLPPLAAL